MIPVRERSTTCIGRIDRFCSNRVTQAGVFVLLLLLYPAGRAAAGIFVVTTTQDMVPGSLRVAIANAEAPPSAPDTIVFAIPGAGPHIIVPLLPLPTLTDRAGLLIDGFTQPGSGPGSSPPSTATLMIVLDGIGAGACYGIWIMSPNNTIRGLVIRGFQRDGIRIQATPQGTFNNRIYGNFIGTTPNGAASAGNGTNQLRPWAGVSVLADPATLGFATTNVIRGNLISSNYSEGVSISSCPPGDVAFTFVDSNYIGTDITGSIDLGNRVNGVYIGEAAHDNLIAHNLIAGNDTDGVCIVGYVDQHVQWHTPQNTVTFNVIGLAADRTTPLPNGRDGVMIGIYGSAWRLGFAPRNRVIQNLISWNGRNGVTVWEHPFNAFNADNNTISKNAMRNNGALGIDLDADGVSQNDPGDADHTGNQRLNVPLVTRAGVLAGVDTVSGSIAIDTDPTKATVEVFLAQPCAAGSGQGKTFIGSAIPDAAGAWSLSGTGLLSGIDTVSATVTDSAGNTSEFSIAVPVNPPLITAPLLLDFGTVTMPAACVRFLTIYNTGAATLAISATSIPAGAFAVDSGGAPFAIAAGDSAIVRLRFTPAAAGLDTATLTIRSNAFNAPALIVTLTGSGIARAPAIVPGATALHFGTVQQGGYSLRILRVGNAGNDTLVISGFAMGGSDSLLFTVMRSCASRLAPGASDSMELRFTPASVGLKEAALLLASNDPNLPVARVTLRGVCTAAVPTISLDASSLDFGTVLIGAARTKFVIVRNSGSASLHVSRQTVGGSDSSEFAVASPCASSIAAGATDSVGIRFTPSSARSFSAHLALVSDDPATPVARVQLQGSGATAPVPRLVLGSTVLDFGSVPRLGVKDEDLALQNSGSADLRLTQQSIHGPNGSDFSILLRADTLLAPGRSTRIRVRHAPVLTGTKVAILRVQSNDPALPTADIALISMVTGVETAPDLPHGITLHANYPNPIRSAVTIRYELDRPCDVELSLYSILGVRVRTIEYGPRPRGAHTVTFEAASLPAGTYTAMLLATDAQGKRHTAQRRLVILQ